MFANVFNERVKLILYFVFIAFVSFALAYYLDKFYFR